MIADYDSLVDTSGSEKSESESQISELYIILCTKLSQLCSMDTDSHAQYAVVTNNTSRC